MNNNTQFQQQKFPFKFKVPNSPQRPTTATNVKTNNAFPINLNQFHPFPPNTAPSCSSASNSFVNNSHVDQAPETLVTTTGPSPQLQSCTRPQSQDSSSTTRYSNTAAGGRALFEAINNPTLQPESDFASNQSMIHHDSYMNALTPIPEEMTLAPKLTPPPFNTDIMTMSDPQSESLDPVRDTHDSPIARPMKRPKLSISMDPGTITGAIDQLAETCESYQTKVTSLQSELQHLNTTVQNLQQQLATAQTTNVKLSKDLSLAQTTNKLVKQNLKSHADQLQDYQAIRAQLSSKSSELDQFKEESTVKANQLQAELNTASSERDLLTQQLESVKENQKVAELFELKLAETSESVCNSVQDVNTSVDSVRTLVQENADHHANLQLNMDKVMSLADKSVTSIACVVPQVSDRIDQLESLVTEIVPEVSSVLSSSNHVVKDEIIGLGTALNQLSQAVHENMTNTIGKSELLRSELEDLKLKEVVLTCELDQARTRIHQLETELTKVQSSSIEQVKQLESDLIAANDTKIKELADLHTQIQVLTHDNQILVQDMANLQETHTNEIRSMETKHTQAVHEQELLTQSLNETKQALGSVPMFDKLSDLRDQLSTCLTQAQATSDAKIDQVLDVTKRNQYRMGQVEECMVGSVERFWSLTSDELRKLHSFFVESSGASEDRRRRDIAQVLDEVTKVTEALMAVHDHVPAAVVTRILDKCVTENLVIGTNTSTPMHNGSACMSNGRTGGGLISPANYAYSMGSKEDAVRFFNMQALHSSQPPAFSYMQQPQTDPAFFGQLTAMSEQGISKQSNLTPMSNVPNPVSITMDDIISSTVSITSSQSDTGHGTGVDSEENNAATSQSNVPVESPVQNTQAKSSAVEDPFAFPISSVSPQSPKLEVNDELQDPVHSKLRSSSHASGSKKTTTTRGTRVPAHKPTLKSVLRTPKRVQFKSPSNSSAGSQREGSASGGSGDEDVVEFSGKKMVRGIKPSPAKKSTPVRTSRSKRK